MSQNNRTQETVYVFKPGDPKVNIRESNIRRRLKAAKRDESEHLQERRLNRFLHARRIMSCSVNEVRQHHLNATLSKLSEFVESGAPGRLPTTFLLKADVSEYIKAVRQLNEEWRTISIHSKECPNFKSTLKLIVNRFTENDPQVLTDRRLTYDFNVLIAWLAQHWSPSSRLLLIIEDTDSFDPEIICNLISHMHSHVEQGQLPLHLILNLSTPLPLFEEKITHDNEISMATQVLHGAPSTPDLVELCSKALYEEPSLKLMLGNSLTARITSLEVNEAIQQMEYAILGHFAGNPLASIEDTAGLYSHEDFVKRLPSVSENLKQDANYLNKLYEDKNVSLADEIPEFRVGGNVLEMAFNPNYRPIIETALTDPRHFLTTDGGVDRMSIPLCVLYQLSRESSIYINIYDFYCAFKSMVRSVPDCKNWDTQSMAIFLESIASLKMLGILRDCKRKFECVEKVAWKGV